jgi:hypothetical protein
LGGGHSGFDCLNEKGDLAFGVTAGLKCANCGLYRAAALVAQYHEEFHAFLDCKLEASEDGVVNYLPCRPRDEHIPQTLIEDQLWRNAGINASQDSGPRVLALGNLCLPFG